MVTAELAVAVVERTIAELQEQHERRVERLQRRLDRARSRRAPHELSGRELLRLAAGKARRRIRRHG